MTTLSMIGPLKLNSENVDKLIKAHSPGNFALGYIEGKAFIVKYIGRSDFDLNQKLKDCIGKYSHFKWSYASSPKEAFIKECQNYHDFGGYDELDNDTHPVKPGGAYIMCEYCGI
jgi:hypothetical protein